MPNTLNLSQKNISTKINAFYQRYFPDVLLPDDFSKGICHGYLLLWFYCFWLSTQDRIQPADDYAWYTSTRDTLALLDGSQNLLDSQIYEIFRWVEQILFKQGDHPFLRPRQFHFADLIQDDKNRRARRIYSIAGYFNRESFTEVLKQLLVGSLDCLFVISTYEHSLGFYNSNQFLYFDANEKIHPICYGDLESLTKRFFSVYCPKPENNYCISVNILSMVEKAANCFPSPKTLLSQYALYNANIRHPSPLTFSSSADCLASTHFYLKRIKTNINEFQQAILSAVRNANNQMLKLFLIQGAMVETQNDEQQSLLFMATVSANLDIIKTLVYWGADLNFQHPKTYYTPLMYASAHGLNDIVDYFIRSKANLDLRNIRGRTATHLALLNTKNSIAEKLLQAGSDPFILDKFHKSAASYIRKFKIQKFKYLVDNENIYLHNSHAKFFFKGHSHKRKYEEAFKQDERSLLPNKKRIA